MKSLLMLGVTFVLSFFVSFFALSEEKPGESALPPTESFTETKAEEVLISVENRLYQGGYRFVEGELYVDLAAYCEAFAEGGALSTEEKTDVFVSRSENFTVEAAAGKEYLSVSGVYHWCPYGNVREGETLFVPFHVLAAALGGTVTETETGVFSVSAGGEIPSGESYYNADDVFWLSRIINAESGGEFLRGKIAVGNVVLNRVRSEEFPDTVYEVIFDIRFGVQFSPVASGSVYRTPSAESVIAAKLCLSGALIDGEMLYFYNPRKSDSTWMVENCTFVGSIGNHDFFS